MVNNSNNALRIFCCDAHNRLSIKDNKAHATNIQTNYYLFDLVCVCVCVLVLVHSLCIDIRNLLHCSLLRLFREKCGSSSKYTEGTEPATNPKIKTKWGKHVNRWDILGDICSNDVVYSFNTVTKVRRTQRIQCNTEEKKEHWTEEEGRDWGTGNVSFYYDLSARRCSIDFSSLPEIICL